MNPMAISIKPRAPQVCVLGSAEPGSAAYELAGDAGEFLARAGLTVVSGCGPCWANAHTPTIIIAASGIIIRFMGIPSLGDLE